MTALFIEPAVQVAAAFPPPTMAPSTDRFPSRIITSVLRLLGFSCLTPRVICSPLANQIWTTIGPTSVAVISLIRPRTARSARPMYESQLLLCLWPPSAGLCSEAKCSTFCFKGVKARALTLSLSGRIRLLGHRCDPFERARSSSFSPVLIQQEGRSLQTAFEPERPSSAGRELLAEVLCGRRTRDTICTGRWFTCLFYKSLSFYP
jgi:hypothetical protein